MRGSLNNLKRVGRKSEAERGLSLLCFWLRKGNPMNQELKKQATELTIELLLLLRKEFLEQGASSLSHWEQMQTRLAIASRTAATIDLWYSTLLRGLRLEGLNLRCCESFELLRGFLLTAQIEQEWIAEMDKILPAIIAKTRVAAESRKNWKEPKNA
jgi:hypothetical protein